MGTNASRGRLGVVVTGCAVLGVAAVASLRARTHRHRAEEPGPSSAGPSAPGVVPGSPGRPGRARRTMVIALAGLLVVAGAAVLPAFASGGDSGAEPPAAAVTTSTVAPATAGDAAPAAAVGGEPSPLELQERAIASFTPEQQAEFALMLMTHEEREAFFSLLTTTTTLPPTTVPTVPPTVPVVPVPEVVIGGGAPAPAVPVGVWDDLAYCEATGNWHINTGNGYYGGLQFAHSTWVGYGGQEFAAYAHQATREQQIAVAERVRASQGGTFRAWPGCRRKLGLP